MTHWEEKLRQYARDADPEWGPVAEVQSALDELAKRLAGRVDPRLGPATLSVGLIGGGQAANVVPPDAWLHLDRRLLPGESVETFSAEIRAALEEAGLDKVQLTAASVEKPALATDADSVPVRA